MPQTGKDEADQQAPRLAPPPASSQRSARIVLAVLFAAAALWLLWDFLPALAWAAVFAIATWPLYWRFAALLPSRRREGELPPLIFTLLIALIFILPVAAAAIEAGREAVAVARWAIEATRTGLPVPARLAELPLIGGYASEWWQANLSEPAAVHGLFGRVNGDALVAWTRLVGAQLAHRLLLFAFTLLTLFFLYRDGVTLGRQILGLSGRAFGKPGEQLILAMTATVRGTVDGMVLVGLGEGLLLGISYAVAGLPHAALLGAVTAVLAIIPFGAPVVFGIGALVLVAEGKLAAAAILFGFGCVVVFIADHFVRPALIGGSMRLPFLLVLLGILGGLESLGLLGLFVGPAIMAAIVALWRDMVGRGAAEG